MSKLIALYRNELYKTLHRRLIYVFLVLSLLASLGIAVLGRVLNARDGDTVSLSHREQPIETNSPSQPSSALLEFELTQADQNPTTKQARDAYEAYGRQRANEAFDRWQRDHKAIANEMYESWSTIQSILQSVSAPRYAFERTPEAARTADMKAAYAASEPLQNAIDKTLSATTLSAFFEGMAALPVNSQGDMMSDSIRQRVLSLQRTMLSHNTPPQTIMNISMTYRSYLNRLAKLTAPDAYAYDAFLTQDVDQLRGDIQRIETNVERNLLTSETSGRNATYWEILIPFLYILISTLFIMLGGATVASERSSGALKSLILAPVNRWKIVAAKLLALTTLLVGFVLLSALFANVAMTVVGQMPCEAVCLPHPGGRATVIAGPLVVLVRLALLSVSALFFMVCGVMLSVVTPTTTAAVAIPLGLLYGIFPILDVVSRIVPNSRWLHLSPHLPLSVVAQSVDRTPLPLSLQVGRPSLTASIVIIAVYLMVMLITTFDGFNRREF